MNEENGLKEKVRRTIFGRPRNIKDPHLFHKLALIPLLAWIGLGADGLSSSSYGPEEAFKTLGSHTYLALFLALATAMTVLIISKAYAGLSSIFLAAAADISSPRTPWARKPGSFPARPSLSITS
jgi:hypothetical protein